MGFCRRFRARALSATALTALSLAAFGGFSNWAYAQTQDDSAQGANDDDVLEEVVVTGSRIKRSNLTTPIPVSVVDAQDIELTGSGDIIDSVQKIPALLNSINNAQSADAQGIDGGGRVTDGVALLNLRSMGTKRTLVLVDGRRHVGGRADDTAVDINTIPATLVERVEVLTGGASAIYGADAVSGVVNFIMKHDFEGFTARTQFTSNDHGNGSQFLLSATGGTNFANGDGNATMSVEYRNNSFLRCGETPFCRNNGIADDRANPDFRIQDSELTPELIAAGIVGGTSIPTDPSDPDFALFPPALVARAQNALPRVFRKQPNFNVSAKGGRIAVDVDNDGVGDEPGESAFFLDLNNNGRNDLGETYIGQFGYGDFTVKNGQLVFFDQGQVSSFADGFGGDGIENNFDFMSVLPQQERVLVNSTLDYKIAPQATFFMEGKFVYSNTRSIGGVNGFNDQLTIRNDNPFIPQQLRDAIEAVTGGPYNVLVTRDWPDLQPNEQENDRYTLRIVSGLKGDLTDSISYEVSYNYGRTDENNTNKTQRIEDRFFAAIDVVTDPATGLPACRSEVFPNDPPPTTSPFPFIEPGFRTFTPGDGTCKPINVFGAFNQFNTDNPEGIDFATTDVTRNDSIEQQVFSAIVSGDSSDFFELPAGTIGFAFGTEYRKESSSARPDKLSELGLVFDGTKVAGLVGNYDVWEGFGEINIPLIKDMPFIRDLSIDGAVRFANYSTIGSSTSWKIGGNWTVLPDIRFRGSFSRAVRAPNIGELFQAPTAAFFRPIDPCDQDIIDAITDPARQQVRQANCVADGIPMGFTDPLTGRFAGESGGNANLDQETADTATFGAVVTPSFLENLSLSIDYWNIDLKNAIEFLDDQTILDNCYDDPNGLNNQFCGLVGRNRIMGSGTFLGLNFVRTQQGNIGGKKVAGVDFDMKYRLEMAVFGRDDLGAVDFSLTGTWLDKINDLPFQNDPATIDPGLREIRRPKWAVNGNVRWFWNALTVNYQVRYMSNQARDDVQIEDARTTFVNPFAGTIWVHDIAATYQLNEQISFVAGINNIGDRNPIITSSSFPTNPLGRRFFIGVTAALGQ